MESTAQRVGSHLQQVGTEGPAMGSGTDSGAALDSLRPCHVHSPSSAPASSLPQEALLFCTPVSAGGKR